MGQWSDGIGSNLMQDGMNNDGISLQVECFDYRRNKQMVTFRLREK